MRVTSVIVEPWQRGTSASAAQSRVAAPGAAAPMFSAARAASVHAYPANTLGGGLSSPRPLSRSASRTDSGLSPRLYPLRGSRSGSACLSLQSLVNCFAGPPQHPLTVQLTVLVLHGPGAPSQCGERHAAAAGRLTDAGGVSPHDGARLDQGESMSSCPTSGTLQSTDAASGRPKLGRSCSLLLAAAGAAAAGCNGASNAPLAGPAAKPCAGPAAATLRGRQRLRLAGGGAAGPALASLAGSGCLRGRPRLRRGRPAAAAGAATAAGASSCSGSSAAACTNMPLAATALARCGGRSYASTAGRPPRPAARGAASSALCRLCKAAGSRPSGTPWTQI